MRLTAVICLFLFKCQKLDILMAEHKIARLTVLAEDFASPYKSKSIHKRTNLNKQNLAICCNWLHFIR